MVGAASLVVAAGSLLGQAALAKSPEPFPCSGNACEHPGHDPSALQRTNDGYYVTLVTGSGGGEAFGMKYLDPSDYSKGWMQGDNSYLIPKWLLNYEPWKSQKGKCGDGKTSACPFWAPDIPTSGNGMKPGGDKFIMYYSVPALDGEGSGCIGVAKGAFGAPRSKSDRAYIDWTDYGEPVICGSALGKSDYDGPHTIDPSVAVDKDGKWWLTYGSWSSNGPGAGGVWSVELDAETGLLGSAAKKQCGDKFPYCWSKDNTAFYNLANNPKFGGKYDDNAIEASYLYTGPQYYYMFVNYYWCCRGMASTYELHVGRSTSPTGPFVDRGGVDMTKGGSELVLGNITKTGSHTMVGPGHAGIMKDNDGRYAFTFDFMAVDSNNNQNYQTQARVLTWDKDGWPVLGEDNFIPSSSVIV